MDWHHRLKLIIGALFLIIIIASPNYEVKGQLDQICVTLGNLQLDDDSTLYSNDDPTSRNPNFCSRLSTEDAAADPGGTIGASKFRLTRYGLQMLGMPDVGCVVRRASDQDMIQLNAVKSTDGYYLRGWLSFGLKIEQKVHWLFVQVTDEDGNAIGEFLNEGVATLCGKNNFPSSVKFGKPHQFLPCSTAGPQEPRVAQAAVYVNSDSLNNPGAGGGGFRSISEFLEEPDRGNKLEMRFLWRLNEYYCNRHEKFRVILFFLADGSSNTPQFIQSVWLHPKWFGVADVLSMEEEDSLECLSPFGSALQDPNYWIERSEPSTPSNDNFATEAEEPGLDSLVKSCKTYLTRTAKYRSVASNQPSFGGRCESKDEKKFKPGVVSSSTPSRGRSSVDVPHDCEINSKATYPPNMESYTEYLEKRRERREQLCDDKITKCPPLDAEAVKNQTRHLMMMKEWMPFATGRYIKRTQAYHGLTMSWAFLFFVPMSNFIARYFKETFLDMDVLGLRLWTVLHIGGAFWAVGMIATALTASFRVSNVYGYSYSPVARKHVIMGWLCIGMFVLTALLGPVRPLSPRWRSVVMVAHAVIGFSHYVIGLCLIISSTIIPGSPSATICYRDIPPGINGVATLFQHQNTVMVLIWLGLDVVFHMIMNRIQSLADSAWTISRPHWFPLTPIVKLDDTRSFKFFRYRIFVLLIYLIFILSFMGVLWKRLYSQNWLECDAGPMTCTHRSNSAEDAYPDGSICGRMAEIRAWRKANLK